MTKLKVTLLIKHFYKNVVSLFYFWIFTGISILFLRKWTLLIKIFYKNVVSWIFFYSQKFLIPYNRALLSVGKVWTFWEGHKIWKNLPPYIWRYSVMSNFKWNTFQNFVLFSKRPNFNFCWRSVLFMLYCI